MLHYATECPHCGNEITVNNARETQKCCWCRRIISVKLERTKNKKIRCEVEPVDFTPENQSPNYKKQSYSRWKDDDIYGRKEH